MSGGYANPVIKLDFSDSLSQNPATDPIWVIIRNPRLMPPDELNSVYNGDSGYDDDGKVTSRDAALATTAKLIVKLVVAARVYDPAGAADALSFDPLTGEITGGSTQPLLPPTPWGPEIAAKLPTEIRTRIMEEFAEAQSPKQGSEPGTPKN